MAGEGYDSGGCIYFFLAIPIMLIGIGVVYGIMVGFGVMLMAIEKAWKQLTGQKDE